MTAPSTPLIVDIVDDDPDVLGSLRFLLEAEGFEVRTFANGADCLDRQPGEVPDCFVIDYKMAPMNGLDLVRQLRASGQLAPIVLITGFPDETIPARALLDGVRHVLRKPHMDESLVTHVRAAMAESRGERPSQLR